MANGHGVSPLEARWRREQRCDHCDQPGVNFYDQDWCCESCGQDVLDRLSEEALRPRSEQTLPPGRLRKKKESSK